MKAIDKPVAREILTLLLRTAKAGTIRSIYERIEPDESSVIRSSMSPGGTETGRFSHSETFLEKSTNLANLPKKTASADPLYNVRECIIPHPGRVLWKADYSQAEARWCAWLANDRKRIEMYERGIDQYRYFVSVLKWGREDRMDEVTKLERNVIGKVGILAGQYKVSWLTLQQNVNAETDLHGISIDAATAKKMEALWPELFPDTVRWWHEVEEEVLTKGYLVNPFGRKRYFFGRRDTEQARAALVREAIAFGPQSANADCLNRALRTLYEEHDPHDLRILLQVHDEIVGDCRPQDVLKVAQIVTSVMERPVHLPDGRVLTIPAEFAISSRSWADAKEIERPRKVAA